MTSSFAKVTFRGEKNQYWANKDAQELILSIQGVNLPASGSRYDLEQALGYPMNSGVYSLTANAEGILKISKIRYL